MKKVLVPGLFILFLSIPLILPFFYSGYFPTHDGEWAVVRLADMFRTLRDLQIPARYSGALNFGYGYPLFNFAYPFPYYLGTFLHFFGFGFVDTVKILFAASVPLSGFFMFLASGNLWKNAWAGIISAILYMYLPYRMVDLYVRGSIGESLSLIIFPLLIYFFLKFFQKPSYVWSGGMSVLIAILIMTHNIMSVIFLPAFFLFVAIQISIYKKYQLIKPMAISIILGLGLSAFFFLPALLEKQNILLSKIPIADRNLYYVKLEELIFPRWGYGVPTDSNGFSYQLGVAQLWSLLVAIILLIHNFLTKTLQKKNLLQIPVFLILLILFFLFLLFSPSAFLWERLPFLSDINYPWTTLAVTGFLVSLLSGFLSTQKITKYIAVAIVITAITMVLPYANPQSYVNRGDAFYITNEGTTTSSQELMPLWVQEQPYQHYDNKVEIESGMGKIESVFFNSKKINFNINVKEHVKVIVNTIYYPGWSAYLDGKEIKIDYNNHRGIMEIKIPSGSHSVKLSFSETPLRLFADSVSVISLAVLLFLFIRRQFFSRNN